MESSLKTTYYTPLSTRTNERTIYIRVLLVVILLNQPRIDINGLKSIIIFYFILVYSYFTVSESIAITIIESLLYLIR